MGRVIRFRSKNSFLNTDRIRVELAKNFPRYRFDKEATEATYRNESKDGYSVFVKKSFLAGSSVTLTRNNDMVIQSNIPGMPLWVTNVLSLLGSDGLTDEVASFLGRKFTEREGDDKTFDIDQ